MQVFERQSGEWRRVDPDTFTGEGRVQRLAVSDGAASLKVYRVEFEARSRTNWHRHSGMQLLTVVEGRCRIQKWGETAEEQGPGSVIVISPDEKHWHGASSESPMTHIAINLDAATTWLEPVTDEQYE